jgi:hypothetical protein
MDYTGSGELKSVLIHVIRGPSLEPVQIVVFFGLLTAKNPIFGLFWSLQGTILAFATPKFQILNRLLVILKGNNYKYAAPSLLFFPSPFYKKPFPAGSNAVYYPHGY